jgi:hypothetical protein
VLLAGCCNVETIRTLTLPDGVVGRPYSAGLLDNCAGESTQGERSWSVSGSLPPGIRFQGDAGRLDGVPTQAGTYDMTISLLVAGDGTEANTVREARGYTLTIRPSQ